uniref:Uncharacterized protein LOC101496411 n=1 Tax=Cicer arietinum TaxID=3827 RepID=A0A1S2XV49_CICAR|nr:uncharacterized protein LOC101496411 [Cicer arietinum]
MDREWMCDPSKKSEEYIRGVNEFLEFAFQNSQINGKIMCPCTKCANCHSYSRVCVYEHLTDPHRGFLRGYRQWIYHGEKPRTSSSATKQNVEMEHDMDGLVHDVFGVHSTEEPICGEGERIPEVRENSKFYEFVKENEQMLYPNCKKYSKLSFMVHLYHLKCLHGWSDKSFSMLLDLLRDALPEENVLPKSYYETKKIVSGLGLGYEKIHACPNDCILYWDKYAKYEVCPKCSTSRWKTTNEDVQGNGIETSDRRKKIPTKILRWFPLKPRLQRLYMSSKVAESMRWHHESRLNDGSLRHPADSLAWKNFDARYPTFSLDPRNVRLGVASDGFNPFKTMSITHSTWPVILIPYNLPPWMCMKQPYFMLSLLIPGPKGPGNNIDIYLQPLVQELQELWDDGIETFDAYKKETFQLRAAMMWTINDFPAYANLSGWSTKGQYACPCCGIETTSQWLRHGKKFCYMGHRRWLSPKHKWRLNSRDFDGTRELRIPPKRLDGTDILRQIDECREKGLANGAQPWKKKSIFFTLPYWQYNVLRHNLDVMHIEKNVCDNIIGTLLNQEGKSKDNYKARADLVDMGIRSMLHPQPSPNITTTRLPRACYQMTNKEKESFLSILKNVKTPDECSSNIPRCVHVKQHKMFGLKSYDCHVLMQELLPVALRGSLPDKVTSVLVDLCNFFKQICSKVLNVEFLSQLESQIVITLCQLETIFPPSFFTVMMHLVIHLAHEAQVAGPVQYRWMYPIERFLLTLKSFVRNRAHPEGSIAEGFLANECLTFCSQYLSGVETRFNRPNRNDDEVSGRPLGIKKQQKLRLGKRKKVSRTKLDKKELAQAHRYVLSNCDAVAPFIEEHILHLKRQCRPRRLTQVEIDKQHGQKFIEWFKLRIQRMDEQKSSEVTHELRWLSRGPSEVVRRYTGYAINGFRFHTKKRERFLKTQNSGVVVKTKTSKDEINYYGAITDTLLLDYSGKYKFVLFKCD